MILAPKSGVGWMERWPQQINPELRAWLEAFVHDGPRHYIANVETDFRLLASAGLVLPITVNHTEYASSYVCSPYNAFVAYAREELGKLQQPLLQGGLGLLIAGLGCLLRAGQINRNVHLNNWLLSTNLYPDMADVSIAEITHFLLAHFPKHAYIFRSLNEVHHGPLLEALRANGYQLVPARQVYLFDGVRASYMDKKNTRRDLGLLAKTPYEVVAHDGLNSGDYPRMAQLYKLLYLDKYSQHNPCFTQAFMACCHRRRLMRMTGLRDGSGRLQGIVGTFERNGVVTTPLVGYNTALPRKEGLYRLLMAITLRDVARRKLKLNLSAGASSFKILRGGEACLEYAAVYSRHLPLFRRGVLWSLRRVLETVGVPLLRRYRL